MAILPLENYNRRFMVQVNDKLTYQTTKGKKLIITGMIIGVRSSHDGRKIRCIVNDEINKVFTLTREDYRTLMDNSIPVDEAIEKGYIS